MDWMNQIGNLVQQYAGARADQAPATAHEDFDQVSRAAPRSTIADGIAAALRSDQTPPFAQMVSQLFAQSNGEQRAGLLNTLLSAAGPALLSQVLGRSGASGLGGILGGGQTQVTPSQAEQVSPQAVEEIAARAADENPSIIDRIGDFFADHPALVQSLGAAAVSMVLARVAERSRGG
jgi:hypothetical protein